MNKVVIAVLVSVACLLSGCHQNSGAGDPEAVSNQTPQVPTSGRSPSSGHSGSSPNSNGGSQRDPSCLRASCGDNFLHHLTGLQLRHIAESELIVVHSPSSENKKIAQEAAILGGELKSIFPQLDFSDAKTQECALWLLERIRQVIEKGEDISNMNSEIRTLETT